MRCPNFVTRRRRARARLPRRRDIRSRNLCLFLAFHPAENDEKVTHDYQAPRLCHPCGCVRIVRVYRDSEHGRASRVLPSLRSRQRLDRDDGTAQVDEPVAVLISLLPLATRTPQCAGASIIGSSRRMRGRSGRRDRRQEISSHLWSVNTGRRSFHELPGSFAVLPSATSSGTPAGHLGWFRACSSAASRIRRPSGADRMEDLSIKHEKGR